MQTFLLDVDSYEETARILDFRRLGKQRVECAQILSSLLGLSEGWRKHPTVKMWNGYENQLMAYSLDICCEWQRRGYQDIMKNRILTIGAENGLSPDWQHPPVWLTEELCLSHRSNLVRKMPDFYRPIWPDVPDNLPYLWPV